jgi:hypothetical protein
MRIAIELNDTAIIIHDGVRLINNSPGYAIETKNDFWIGNEARDRAYLYSNQCNNKFWYEIACADKKDLNQQNINLAMRHLEHAWGQVETEVNTVVLIVPGTFTKTGLGLLLGICKELNIPVQAMVHQSVLCPYQVDHKGETVHVDIQLHHTVITPLKKIEKEFIAADSKVLHGSGLIKLYEHIAEYLAQEFIKKTRLDPMHNAQLEQQLYDCLPDWLQQSQNNDTVDCKLQYKNKIYEIEVHSPALHSVYERFIDTISKTIQSASTDNNIIVCLSGIIDSQLGLRNLENKHQLNLRVLDTAYFAKQSFEYNDEILSSDGQVYLNKQLPYKPLSDPLNITGSINDNHEQPDHVLFRDYAYGIKDRIVMLKNIKGDYELKSEYSGDSEEVFIISKTAEGVYLEHHTPQRITVNEQAASLFCNLGIGDRIRISESDEILTLIKVEA